MTVREAILNTVGAVIVVAAVIAYCVVLFALVPAP